MKKNLLTNVSGTSISMKKKILILILFVLGLRASAQVVYSESFNYSATTNLVGQGGWLQAQGSTNFQIVSPGLTFSGYPLSGSDNAAKIAGNSTSTEQEYYGLSAPISTGSFYCSFLVNVGGAPTVDDFIVGYSPSTSAATYAGARLFVKNDGSGNLAFGIHADLGGTPQVSTGFNYHLNTTYLIVMKYSFIAGTNNNELSLFVLPSGTSIPTAEPAATLGPQLASGGEMGDIIRITLVAHLASVNTTIDGIQIASSWAALFPVPAAVEKSNQSELISVYPNPAEELIHFSKPVSVTLMNMEGKVVDSKSDTDFIEVNKLTKGIYILKCSLNDAVEYKRIEVK